ncbi:MAG: hypothetical protein NTZ86_00340 [Legionellales bacterium]|nr:hypothetical protein [Legionellales bacterium]
MTGLVLTVNVPNPIITSDRPLNIALSAIIVHINATIASMMLKVAQIACKRHAA